MSKNYYNIQNCAIWANLLFLPIAACCVAQISCSAIAGRCGPAREFQVQIEQAAEKEEVLNCRIRLLNARYNSKWLSELARVQGELELERCGETIRASLERCGPEQRRELLDLAHAKYGDLYVFRVLSNSVACPGSSRRITGDHPCSTAK